jgi:hypothetical protein
MPDINFRGNKQNIKSSLLRRILTVPRLPENALNIYNNDDQNAGVLEVTIPNETYSPVLIAKGTGVFNFGGIETSDDGVSITKIIIDDIVVFDSDLAGGVLKNVFAHSDTTIGSIAGNTPPYLVNEFIEIYATNNNRNRGWWGTNETIFISLVPIE